MENKSEPEVIGGSFPTPEEEDEPCTSTEVLMRTSTLLP
jgi:hypothetical protein